MEKHEIVGFISCFCRETAKCRYRKIQKSQHCSNVTSVIRDNTNLVNA